MQRSNQGRYRPIQFSVEVSYTPCPALVGTNATCASDPPPVNITSSLVILSNGTFTYRVFSDIFSVIDSDLYAPIANIIQTIHASVRIDLGNPHKNNFLLNPSVLNATLSSAFSAEVLPNTTVSTLYEFIANRGFFTLQNALPLKVEGLAKLQTRYLCQLQRMKAPAQAFIAVLVATLSMFVSGWGLVMLFASYWAKKGNDSANNCVGHDKEFGMNIPLLPK